MPFKYIVLNENTLGYEIEWNAPKSIGILGSKIDGKNPLNGWTCYAPESDKVRPATKEDFEYFRVALPPDFDQ